MVIITGSSAVRPGIPRSGQLRRLVFPRLPLSRKGRVPTDARDRKTRRILPELLKKNGFTIAATMSSHNDRMANLAAEELLEEAGDNIHLGSRSSCLSWTLRVLFVALDGLFLLFFCFCAHRSCQYAPHHPPLPDSVTSRLPFETYRRSIMLCNGLIPLPLLEPYTYRYLCFCFVLQLSWFVFRVSGFGFQFPATCLGICNIVPTSPRATISPLLTLLQGGGSQGGRGSEATATRVPCETPSYKGN